MKISSKTVIGLSLTSVFLIMAILSLSLVSSAENVENDTNTKVTAIDETVTSLNDSVNEILPMTVLPEKWIPIILGIVLFVFAGILIMGYSADKDLNKGEMRRAIAGTFVIGFTFLLLLSIFYEFKNKDIVTAYIQMTGVVIGFYFGTRSILGKQKESSNKLSIENVKFELDGSGNPDKKITISIRNGSDASIIVDKIYLNRDDYDIDSQIVSQKAKKETIKLSDVWKYGEEYKIKVATTTGEMDENVFSPPRREGDETIE